MSKSSPKSVSNRLLKLALQGTNYSESDWARVASVGRVLLLLGMRMYRINPVDFLWIFYWIDVRDVHYDRFVVGSNQNAFQHIVGIGINFLMRNIGRNENKIAWSGLGDVFEMISPSHTRFASKNKDDAFQCTMVMNACLRIGLDCDRSCPDFLRSNTRVIDRCLTEHSRRLRGVGVKLIAFYHANAVVFPSFRMFMMIVIHGSLHCVNRKNSYWESIVYVNDDFYSKNAQFATPINGGFGSELSHKEFLHKVQLVSLFESGVDFDFVSDYFEPIKLAS